MLWPKSVPAPLLKEMTHGTPLLQHHYNLLVLKIIIMLLQRLIHGALLLSKKFLVKVERHLIMEVPPKGLHHQVNFKTILL